jgi:hypothetical protein
METLNVVCAFVIILGLGQPVLKGVTLIALQSVSVSQTMPLSLTLCALVVVSVCVGVNVTQMIMGELYIQVTIANVPN